MHVHFPFTLDSRGGVAEATRLEHLRQLIEQVLFTAPGERVNRPNFGCGLLREVFGVQSHEALITTQFLVQQALATWLGELIETHKVELIHEENELFVVVDFVDLLDRRSHSVSYEVSAL